MTVWTFRCIVCVCDYVGDKKYPGPARRHIENIRVFERPCSTPKKSQKSGVPQKFGVVFLHFSLQKIGILQPQNSGVPQKSGVPQNSEVPKNPQSPQNINFEKSKEKRTYNFPDLKVDVVLDLVLISSGTGTSRSMPGGWITMNISSHGGFTKKRKKIRWPLLYTWFWRCLVGAWLLNTLIRREQEAAAKERKNKQRYWCNNRGETVCVCVWWGGGGGEGYVRKSWI